MALAYYKVGAGHLDQTATARFCVFSWSENRTKLEFSQHCMDSMTSLGTLQRMFAGLYIAPFFLPGGATFIVGGRPQL